MTWRELIYMVVDMTKQISDDSQFNEDHIKMLCSKYRNYILNSQYINRKHAIPDADYQMICVDLENATDSTICGSGNIMRSVQVVPNVTPLGKSEIIPMNITARHTLSIVDQERFRYVDTDRYFSNIIYAALMPDGHLYLKSGSTDFMYMNKVRMRGVFEDAHLASSLDCNVCESQCDVNDTVFPLEDAWINSLINMVVNDLTRGIYALRDTANDAMDSSDDLAQAIQRFTNNRFKRLMRGNQNTDSDNDNE